MQQGQPATPGMMPVMMPGMVPGAMAQDMPSAEDIMIQKVDQRLERMKKNTFEQRAIEGRPIHSQTSTGAIGCLVGSAFCQLFSVALNDWRTNWLGVMLYSQRRSWGVLGMQGYKFTTYWHQSTVACRLSGEFMTIVCSTPLCIWYRQKCLVYIWMFYAMNFLAFFLFVTFIITGLCISYVYELAPRGLSVNLAWCAGAWLGHMSLVLGYVFISDSLFEELMMFSYYPTPYLGFAWYVAMLGNVLLGVAFGLCWRLTVMWPEPDEDDSDDDETDSDEDAALKDAMAMQQQMMMQQQQAAMMDVMPQQGMMAAQQPLLAMDGSPMGSGGMVPQPMGQPQASGMMQNQVMQ